MNDEYTQEERQERLQRLAENLRDVLQDGDEFLVQYYDGEVLVTPSPFSRLRNEQPRLYGRLLSLETQLEGGCGLYVAGLLAAGIFLLGLNVGWWDDWLGPQLVELLNAWWFYLVLPVVVFALVSLLYDWLDRRTYRQARPELFELMHEAGLDRDTLLPLLQNELELQKATRQLKLDRGPFPRLGK